MFTDVECTFSAPEGKMGKAEAYCDIKLKFPQGTITMRGFRIMLTNKGESWVSPPAKRGHDQWFDQVIVTGELRKILFGESVKQYLAWRSKAA